MNERDPNEVMGKCHCGTDFLRSDFARYCGAYVCSQCGAHKGLCKCYCGWSESGGNGYRELLEDGETIEPDGY